jgi:hypothetical protein
MRGIQLVIIAVVLLAGSSCSSNKDELKTDIVHEAVTLNELSQEDDNFKEKKIDKKNEGVIKKIDQESEDKTETAESEKYNEAVFSLLDRVDFKLDRGDMHHEFPFKLFDDDKTMFVSTRTFDPNEARETMIVDLEINKQQLQYEVRNIDQPVYICMEDFNKEDEYLDIVLITNSGQSNNTIIYRVSDKTFEEYARLEDVGFYYIEDANNNIFTYTYGVIYEVTGYHYDSNTIYDSGEHFKALIDLKGKSVESLRQFDIENRIQFSRPKNDTDLTDIQKDTNTTPSSAKTMFHELDAKEEYEAIAWLSDTEIIVNKLVEKDAIPYKSASFDSRSVFIYDTINDTETRLLDEDRASANLLSKNKRYLVYTVSGGMHHSLSLYDFETEKSRGFSKYTRPVLYGFDDQEEHILYHFGDEDDIYYYNISSQKTSGQHDKVLVKLSLLESALDSEAKDSATRGEMEIMLLKLFEPISKFNAGDKLPSLGTAQDILLPAFMDGIRISEEAAPYIAYGVEHGHIQEGSNIISPGNDNFFGEGRSITGIDYMSKILDRLGYEYSDKTSVIDTFSSIASLDGIDQALLENQIDKATFVDITYSVLGARFNKDDKNIAGLIVREGRVGYDLFTRYDIPVFYDGKTIE